MSPNIDFYIKENKKKGWYKLYHPSHKFAYFLIAIITIIVIFILIFYNSKNVIDCGNDADCFLENARNCTDAIYTRDINGTLIYHKIKGCTLTKEITNMGKDEPEEIVKMFLNKKLTCEYTKETFKDELVTTLTKSLEMCDGPLKDSLYDLIVSQYEEGIDLYDEEME